MIIKLINRKNGLEKVFKEMEDNAAWDFMNEWNTKHCDGFAEKGYNFGSEQGMKGVMFFVDGSLGAVCDVASSGIDYTRQNNIK